MKRMKEVKTKKRISWKYRIYRMNRSKKTIEIMKIKKNIPWIYMGFKS